MSDTARASKLTIVLPIHGRQDFVWRFLDLHLPYPIMQLLGDGWFTKIAKGLEGITTPYAMLIDCDDFPQPDGINHCIDFLDTFPDFVCASGRIEGLWLFPSKLHGPLQLRSRQYSPYDTPAVFDQESVDERVRTGFCNSFSYYAVYRTEALRTIWRECVQFDFKDLMIHEKFCAMRALSLGKVIGFDNVTSLVRQYGTSQVAATCADWLKTYSDLERLQILDTMIGFGVDYQALELAWDQWYAERHKTFYGHPIRKWIGRQFPLLRKLSPLLEILR